MIPESQLCIGARQHRRYSLKRSHHPFNLCNGIGGKSIIITTVQRCPGPHKVTRCAAQGLRNLAWVQTRRTPQWHRSPILQNTMSYDIHALPLLQLPLLECVHSAKLGACFPPVSGPILIGTGILLNFLSASLESLQTLTANEIK